MNSMIFFQLNIYNEEDSNLSQEYEMVVELLSQVML
jgi:hypothetical protein